MLILGFKKELNKKNILEELKDQSLVYEYYLKHPIREGIKFISPFRKEKDPSLSFKYFENTNSWVWRDWGDTSQHKSMSIFDFVMRLFNCDFVSAMIRINNDLGLNLEGSKEPSKSVKKFLGNNTPIKHKIEKKKKRIRISFRKYTKNDYDFWAQFGITKNTLKLYRVYPIDKAWLNYTIIKEHKSNDTIFAYLINNNVKIYHPNNKTRFLGNVTLNDISGWDQLPNNGENIIITKSHKDVMVLYEMNISAISPQGEGMSLSKDMIDELELRFNNIYILYDNDDPGIKASDNAKDIYPNLKQIYIPKEVCKDVSELSFIKGLKKAKEIIINLL